MYSVITFVTFRETVRAHKLWRDHYRRQRITILTCTRCGTVNHYVFLSTSLNGCRRYVRYNVRRPRSARKRMCVSFIQRDVDDVERRPRQPSANWTRCTAAVHSCSAHLAADILHARVTAYVVFYLSAWRHFSHVVSVFHCYIIIAACVVLNSILF